MNPKDEIQKLIQIEMKKWKDYEIKNENFRIRQADNFQPLRALLNDLVASIEPEYIKTNILDNQATLEVSNEIDSSSFIRWTIQPNYKTQEVKEDYWNSHLWKNIAHIEAEPGFKVQEKRGDDRGDDGETNSEFGTEKEMINYLAQEIAKRIAYYRYRKPV